jgi:molybdenum cofactor cytidylyltransferase
LYNPGAIILAAGLSQRMGAWNKMLLPIGGIPMIRHMALTYLQALTPLRGEVMVVTGHQAPALRDALTGLPLRLVHNPDYAQGQPGSVATGLRETGAWGPTLMGLGDQPQLTAGDLSDLIDAHRNADTSRIAVPHNGDQRGNPIIIPAPLRADILTSRRNPGCGRYTRDNPDKVQFLPLTAPGFYSDIDTPDDFLALGNGADFPMETPQQPEARS